MRGAVSVLCDVQLNLGKMATNQRLEQSRPGVTSMSGGETGTVHVF